MSNWISVKDALPADGERVWAAVRSLYDDREPWTVEVVYFKKINRNGGSWDNLMVACGEAEVYAWMPNVCPDPPRWEEYE